MADVIDDPETYEYDVPGTASDEIPQQVLEDDVEINTSIETTPDGDGFKVTRTAAFAEVADRPKERAIESERIKNDVAFFDDLVKFDPELSGTLHAKSQAAASGPHVTHPNMGPLEDDRTELEKDITRDCRQLIRDLDLETDGTTFFFNLDAHGNDVSFVEYDIDEGVVDLQALPLRALTILDMEAYRNRNSANTRTRTTRDPIDSPAGSAVSNYADTITDNEVYVINEGSGDDEQAYPAHDILHISLNQRSNWHKDQKGRDTYGVWGERRLESIRYTLQAKQNTLANKVAMDDKLLAREYFYVNVEDLFGHIQDPDERLKKAREYAEELRGRIEDLEADQKPILPEEVTVEVEGPDGDTARNMSNFIQTMNDSIQHALNYHVSAFGRDAGGTDRANKPAKEMSDNSVRHLRNVVKAGFRRLFKIHAMLRYEEAREVADPSAEDIRRFELADDVTLPELEFEPVDPAEQVEKVRNAISMYEKGVADLNEARIEAGLEPVDEDDVEEMMWFRNPTLWSDDDEEDTLYKNQQLPKTPSAEMDLQEQQQQQEDGPDGESRNPDSEGPGDEDQTDSDGDDGDSGDSGDSSGNRRSRPTDSHESYDTYGE